MNLLNFRCIRADAFFGCSITPYYGENGVPTKVCSIDLTENSYIKNQQVPVWRLDDREARNLMQALWEAGYRYEK